MSITTVTTHEICLSKSRDPLQGRFKEGHGQRRASINGSPKRRVCYGWAWRSKIELGDIRFSYIAVGLALGESRGSSTRLHVAHTT